MRPPAPWGWRTSNRPPWKMAAWVLAVGQRAAQGDAALARVEDRAHRERGDVRDSAT